MILDGYLKSKNCTPFVVVGSTNNKYSKYILKKYKNENKIKFLDVIYENDKINNLRYFSKLYFHGNCVGESNPSLLETVGCIAIITCSW